MDIQVKKAMLNQDFSLYALLQTSGTGNKVYEEVATTVKGFLVGRRTIIVDAKGDKIISAQHFYVDTAVIEQIQEGDLITPPGTSHKLPVIGKESFYKIGGILDYGVVYL
jgi:hypothetical protein